MLSLRRKRPTAAAPSGDTTPQTSPQTPHEGLPEGPPTGRVVLQRLTLPDQDITDETGIFVRLDAAAALDRPTGAIHFRPGGTAAFDTYMNLFNLGTWAGHCDLAGLRLDLRGTGRVELALRQVLKGRLRVLNAGPVTLGPQGVPVDLAGLLAAAGDAAGDGAGDGAGDAAGDGADMARGLITLEMTALEPAVLTGGAYTAALPEGVPARTPLALAISITTFRREADVARTVARICGFLEGEGGAMLAGMGARAHLFVVDNGQSVSLPAHPRLTLIPNANLGGAGGFARGLAAAQDGGFSHCLFMDDDAAFQMESLVRTLAFLRLARSPRAAVAGAMISAERPWAMWENGAVFDRSCRPQFLGTDLRDPDEVAAMELAASAPKPPGFYGGWWYFAFPLAHVRHYPFPFFVRGDDISFSLAHDFDTVTLPGVVSFQEDFATKESPQTLYLDLRNHLHHHLVHPKLDIGALRTARIALWFIARSLVRMHYDSAEAQLLSWADVMQGPGFFAGNADMTAKRPQVAALIRTEAWQPLGGDAPVAAPYREPGPVLTRLCKLTLNGHLVPGWRLFARDRVIMIAERGLLWPSWGLAQAIYVDRAGGRSYTVRHDKRRFMALGGRALRLLWRWMRLYPGLKRAYRASYGDLAGRSFWQQRFLTGGLPAPLTPLDNARRAAE